MAASRNFIILFSEKEGTSPLVRLLDNFEKVSVVHMEGNKGWEPFDRHHCGPMRNRDFGRCLDLIYRQGPADMRTINEIYQRTASAPLAPIGKSGAVGFKMRPNTSDFLPPAPFHRLAPFRKIFFWYRQKEYMRILIDVLRRHDVTVFLAIRQDIFRWALSKYHGDGTGKTGQLQFKLAKGDLTQKDLGKIKVDLGRYAQLVQACKSELAAKRKLEKKLREAGIKVQPIRYEDFCGDKLIYFRDFFRKLDMELSDSEIQSALEKGAFFKKVHADDISEFVINHKELTEAYGNAFFRWNDPQ